ncbi:MAG: serine--tRNA ligase, partial [Clostridiales bacterium]|nr:serine--tRNA ligase [Clostridiales bacterium]
MLDIKILRNEFEGAAQALARRGNEELDLRPFLGLDERRRALILEVEELKAQRNAASKDAAANRDEMRELSAKIKELDGELGALEAELEAFLLGFPNLPHESVPDGADADDNVEMRRYLEPRAFDFEPQAHWDLGKNLGILDNEAAGATTGSRFMFLKGAAARMERALMNFMLDINTEESGYTEVFPPFIAHERSMLGTGQLPKFKDDAFKLEGRDMYLIPTSEVTVTNMHRESILPAADLPISYTAFSACFRAE